MSAPATKVRPAQISTMALTALSAIAASTPDLMPLRSAWLSAFTGGLLMVKTATAPTRSLVTIWPGSLIDAPPPDFLCAMRFCDEEGWSLAAGLSRVSGVQVYPQTPLAHESGRGDRIRRQGLCTTPPPPRPARPAPRPQHRRCARTRRCAPGAWL